MRTILAWLVLCGVASGEVLTFDEPPADWLFTSEPVVVDGTLSVDYRNLARGPESFYLHGVDILTPTSVAIIPRRDSNWNGIAFYVPGSPSWQHMPFNLGTDIYTVEFVSPTRGSFQVDNLSYTLASVPEPSSIVLAATCLLCLAAWKLAQ